MRIDENGRECVACRGYKPWTDFNKNSRGQRGFDNRCRACLKVYRQSDAYRQANRVRAKKEYLDPVGREVQKARVKASREKIRQENPEAFRDRQNIWTKVWREKNGQVVKALNRKHSGKWLSKPRNRLSSTMSALIRHSLKKGVKGNRHWEKLMPYTLDELKTHLERLWEPEMTWENHTIDGWHIDHIIPVSSFEFNQVEDQGFKDCWALNNLMPRWATTDIAIMNGSNQIGNINKAAKF